MTNRLILISLDGLTSMRLFLVLLGLTSYLAATAADGVLVLCSGPEGMRVIEWGVGGNGCAPSCAEGEGGESDEPIIPQCVDETLDVGGVRVVASAPLTFSRQSVLCGILPEPVLRPLHWDERDHHPPQHLTYVATVVLVI